ncbi:hypothetical protein MNBD_GAMMA15-2277 [hydrothermal vent metagenome]|uniref:PepSY-associated TM helix n=1 Tax=hydrothermal vent metagenome TaxID=652676 RepID=A0A3B0YCQ3_9ZZZZ
MSKQHHRKQRFKLRSFYVWHRYMGVSAALFTLIIAFTGILLNHTDDFQFNDKHVQTEWVLDWYGIEAPEQLLSFPVGERHITLMGDDLYLDRKEIGDDYRDLTGAVQLDNMLVVSVNNNILLLTPRGEMIERLKRNDGVPAGIEKIGVDASGKLAVRTSHDIYQPEKDFIRWQRYDGDDSHIRWASSVPLEPQLKTLLRNHFRGEVLPMERVLLDLHSGRFFGKAGPWLFDIAAALLILLSLTGTWIWLKRRR